LSGSFKYQTPVTETLKKALIKFTNAAHRVVALRTLLRQRARQLKSLENWNQIRKDTIASSISVTDDQKATVSTMELMADLIGTSDEDTMNDADICQAENTPPTSHIRDQTAIKLASTFLTMKHRYEDALGAKPNFDGLFQVRDDIAVAAAQAYTSLSSGYGTRTIRHTGQCSSCGLKHPRLSILQKRCTFSLHFVHKRENPQRNQRYGGVPRKVEPEETKCYLLCRAFRVSCAHGYSMFTLMTWHTRLLA
jgi:hypothetical protein